MRAFPHSGPLSGHWAWLLSALLFLASFRPGIPLPEDQVSLLRTYQKALKLFNSPNPTPVTDQEAMNLFQRVIDARTLVKGNVPDSLFFQSYIRKGILLDVRSSFREAANSYLAAIRLKEQNRNFQESQLFNVYVYAGTCYYNLNNFDSSRKLLLHAEAIMHEHPEVTEKERLYNSLGALYYDNGNYLQSRNYFMQALDIIRAKRPFDNTLAIYFETNIATSYFRLGEFREALTMYKNIVRHHVIPNSIYMNMGRACTALGRYDEAMQYLRKVNIDRLPGALNEMAYTQLLAGNQSSTARYLDQMDAISQDPLHSVNPLDCGISALYRSQLFTARHEYAAALGVLQKAIIIFSRGFSNPDPFANPSKFIGSFAYYRLFDALLTKSETLEYLYRQHGEEKYLRSAFDTYQSALALAEYIEKNYDTDEAKLFLKKKSQQAYSKAVESALALYKLDKEDRFLEAAFLMTEKNKASVLAASFSERFPDSTSGEEDTLLRYKFNIQYNIARLNIQAETEEHPAVLDSLAGEKMKWEIELSRVHKNLELDDKFYEGKYKDHFPSVRELQEHLGKNEVLFSFCCTHAGLIIFSLTAGSENLYRIDSSALVNNEIIQWVRLLNTTEYGRRFKGDSLAGLVYRHIVQPMKQLAQGRTEWIIIPDGILFSLPFESIRAGPDQQYLVESTTISYLFSSRFLVHPVLPPLTRVAGFTTLGFAPFLSKGHNPGSGFSFDRLPFSGDELAGLQGLILKDSSATKDRFLQEANQFPVIHLATHAVADVSNTGGSFVAFYPGNKPKMETRLYMEELYGLNMDRTRLVIISACETGNGALVAGEGMISLARGFCYAGCPSVVNSLWKADDEATAFILSRFHTYLQKGWTKSLALRQSKIDYICNSAFSSDPGYWANLILVGDPSPIVSGGSFLMGLLQWIAAALLLIFVYRIMYRRKKKKPTGFSDKGF